MRVGKEMGLQLQGPGIVTNSFPELTNSLSVLPWESCIELSGIPLADIDIDTVCFIYSVIHNRVMFDAIINGFSEGIDG